MKKFETRLNYLRRKAGVRIVEKRPPIRLPETIQYAGVPYEIEILKMERRADSTEDNLRLPFQREALFRSAFVRDSLPAIHAAITINERDAPEGCKEMRGMLLILRPVI